MESYKRHQNYKEDVDEAVKKIKCPEVPDFYPDNDCDVVIVLKDRELHAHKEILVRNSPVFKAMFEHGTIESQTNVIRADNFNYEAFIEMLRDFYTGHNRFTYYTNDDNDYILELYIIADFYNVERLMCWCKIELGLGINERNWFLIYKISETYSIDELKRSAIRMFAYYVRKYEEYAVEMFHAAKSYLLHQFKHEVDTTKSKCPNVPDFYSGENHDVVLIVDGRELCAHKEVLVRESSVFKAMLEHGTIESTSHVIQVRDFDYGVIVEMLRFFYTGHISFINYDDDDMNMYVELLIAADYYNVEPLKYICELELRVGTDSNNWFFIYEIAEIYGSRDLQKSMIAKFRKRIDKDVVDFDDEYAKEMCEYAMKHILNQLEIE